MKGLFTYVLLAALFVINSSYAQEARVQGVVLDENQLPLAQALINFEGAIYQTDARGYYQLRIAANREVVLVIEQSGYWPARVRLELAPDENYELSLSMLPVDQKLEEILVEHTPARVLGATWIQPDLLRLIPGANAGVEQILKTLPGVYSNNELSTQYAVRGGNYDENLVYVNEIEVYRPFLIRSGQQEGLSFTNSAMVENIQFSAGGFQAKYGDKLASALDISYRTPREFRAAIDASFLGASLAVDALSKNKKWSSISGLRYRNNKLLVNSQDTKTNFSPTFVDFQTGINYQASARWQWSFLGNISQNRYHYQPLSRQTNFGTLDQPTALIVNYQGSEKDEYRTFFGAIKSSYSWSDQHRITWIASGYQATEQEYYDILATYALGEVNSDLGSQQFGEITYSRGLGSQLNHARNNYDAVIFNAEVKGFHDFQASQIEWGAKYTREDIRDRLLEWEVVDSLGFSLAAPEFASPRNAPYQSDRGPLVPYQYASANQSVVIDRLSAYAQWNHRTQWGKADLWLNAGLRTQFWQVQSKEATADWQHILTPRVQVALKPDWNADVLFRLSGGLYHQPPSYRELRDQQGQVQLDLQAQKSAQLVLAQDYSFRLAQRPFKLTAELYYKQLSNVNTYTLDNVRIRYRADNEAQAYVYGADLRLYGEFVPGAESWLSMGYLKTEENYKDQGYISRPTDQRLKFGLLFQDYMPAIPNLKMYLNLVYNTGLPGGSPSYADPYVYQSRLRDYRRADAGFSYVFKDQILGGEVSWLRKIENLSVGLEIYNLFDNQNAITNTWVRDVYSKMQYGIPNYMTSRTFNLKLNLSL